VATSPGPAPDPAASFAARLAAARAAVTELAAATDQLGEVADDDAAVVMGELTTMAGQLDGLRVAVTGLVRRRGLYRRRGAADVTGWLRADARAADAAASLSRLASMSEQLPQITALLQDGAVSLAQAGTACWQIAQLPSVVTRPEDADAETGATADPGPGEEAWAGLWRGGDLHAAADDLFARFLPGMDASQLRVLGAHLREAADAHDRARDDYNAYAARSLRISRSLGGTAHLSGHLHPEAAEQVLAAFEELGARTGPDDTRTKPQRWADALAYLTGLTYPAAPAPAGPDPHEAPASAGPDTPGQHGTGGPAGAPGDGEPDDDEPSPEGGHGHEPNGHGLPVSDGLPHPAAGTGTGPAAGAPGPGHVAPAGLRRPRVIVTVPLQALLGAPLSPGGVLGAGTPITAEAARRLCCDADLIRLITSHQPDLPGGPSTGPGPDWNATAQLTTLLAGAIAQLPRPLGGPSAALDIGRQSQSWTPRQRDALYAQYGGRCGRPGCTRRIDVLHHIIHWLFGGKTQTSNGAPLCLHDHWLVHEGGWRVSKQPDGALTFIPPPPGWQPGTIYRRGKPIPETNPHPRAA